MHSIKPVVPEKYLDEQTIFHLNPSGGAVTGVCSCFLGGVLSVCVCVCAQMLLVLTEVAVTSMLARECPSHVYIGLVGFCCSQVLRCSDQHA